MAGFFSFVSSFFSPNIRAQEYKSSEKYLDLRNMVFTMSPEKIGLQPKGNDVWGALMEMGFPEGVATLVMIGDGAVSLYYDNGGGIIGLGGHSGPRQAAERFLHYSGKFLTEFKPTSTHPFPKRGSIRFYFLTGGGVVTAEAGEEELVEGRHALSKLFALGNNVLTEVRLADEKLKSSQ